MEDHLSVLKPPAPEHMFREAFTAFELPKLFLRAQELASLKSRNPRNIMVLPGFGAGDSSTLPLRSYLSYMGHKVRGWDRGLNVQDVEATMDELVAVVDRYTSELGEPIVLVGWSLGGYLAREVARDLPDRIEQVFTLGSPIIGGPKYTQVAPLFRAQGIDVDWIEQAIIERETVPLNTKVTAVYSKNAGVVAWRACIDEKSPNVEHIEVTATHIGLGISADAYRIIATAIRD
jgi:pimeloyl-ACP methyl ester carboxylesterase